MGQWAAQMLGVASMMASMDKRQDMSGIIDQLLSLFDTLGGFLTEEFLSDVQIVVHNLADTLANPLPSQAHVVLTGATNLFNAINPLIDDLPDIIETLMPLINQLPALLDQLSPLLDELPKIINAIGPLIDQLSNLDLEGLLNSVSKLLTPESINMLVNLLNNANMLLTTQFVNQTKGLIADVAPVSLIP